MNPLLSSQYYIPDVEARVDQDGTIYLYGSKDIVNDDDYCSNEYQVFNSKDMVHWKLLPSALSTTTLLDMKGNPSSGGIWAPDLSYADGKFWLVYTDVKVTEGPFKDMVNYITTAEDIHGPWSDPIRVNGVGFDASLFHDDDGRKYLVQQTWDHREYHHAFDGITLTEFDTDTMQLKPETARNIYNGTLKLLSHFKH